MKIVTVVLIVSFLFGCASLNHKLVMTDLDRPNYDFLVDATNPDDYPGYLAGQGNIYSCRYGIHHQSAEEFEPPKAEIFAALLSKHIPGIEDHKVVLERFDVYINSRLKLLNMAGTAMGGVIGETVAEIGRVNENVFTFKKIQIDLDPRTAVHPEENMVGCDNANEGEYYASEISGGHDVIVIWLKFHVDDISYLFRSYYQFQPADKVAKINGIDEAIRMTVEGIAPKIKVQ